MWRRVMRRVGRRRPGIALERIEAGLKRDGQPRLVAKWVVDEAKAEKVKQAFAMCAAGCSYNEIHAATALLRTKQSYWSMFRNRTYLGILKFGAEEFPGALPALVDTATFEAVQARVTQKAEGARRARRLGSEYLLSGLVACERGGSLMVGGQDRRNEQRGYAPWTHYRCGGQHRLGAATCDAPYVAADRVERGWWVRCWIGC